MAIDETRQGAGHQTGSIEPALQPAEIVHAKSGIPLYLPNGRFLVDATFHQHGDDLRIVGGDGEIVLVRDYFLFDPPPAIETGSGGWFSPELIASFLISEAAGQYAQVGANNSAEAIGQVQILTGTVFARRVDGTRVSLQAGDSIFQGDVVETGADSTINLIFVDETTFTLGGDARLAIDELVYNPATESGTSTLSILKGAFVFVSGQIAHTDYTDMKINTPVATIGIRGTTVAGDVKAPGERSQFTVIDGEIEVATRVASVTLKDEFATTYVESFDSVPSEPQILTQDQIERDYGAVKEASGGFYDGGALEEIAPEAGEDVTQVGDGDLFDADFGVSFSDFTAVATRLDFLGLLEQFRLDLPASFFSSDDDDSEFFASGGVSEPSLGSGIAPSTSGNDVIIGNPNQPNTIDGGGGDDTITGGNFGDLLAGGEGNDQIDGGAGDDVLFGGSGNDIVFGGAGNDVLIGGSGNGDDSYDGGDGVDTVKYTSAVNAIEVDLSLGSASGVDIDSDVLSTIEHVIGGEGDDLLIGADGEETLEGRGGRDTLVGGEGNDTLIGDGEGVDLVVDTADYSSATGPIAIDFTAAGTVGGVSAGTVAGGIDVGTDVIVGIEQIIGTNADDSFVVGAGFVSDFTNYVEFEGRGGDDTIIGNGATRIAYRDSTGSVAVDLAAGTATGDASVGNDSFTDVNQAVGSAHDDTLIGSNATDDTLLGGDGADHLDGRGGFDVVDYSEADAGVSVNLANGEALDDGFGKRDVLVEIEAVIGSDFGDTITGDDGNNLLIGAAGDDSLLGGLGDDTLAGGDGADTLTGGLGDDTLVGGAADGDSAIDTVDYSAATGPVNVDLTAAGTIGGFSAGTIGGDASVGTDTIVGIERVVGSSDDDTFTVGGAFVSDFTEYVEFEGGAGDDTITGSGDTRVAYRNATSAVTVDLAAGTADGDASVGSDTFTGVNQTSGSAHDDTLLGNNLTNDTLQGEAGDDILDGRDGNDLVDYWNSTAGVHVDLSEGEATQDGFGGSDSLISIEGARGSDHDDTLIGDDGSNRLIGGDGADDLLGGAGSDSLDGGAGQDVLRGEDGNDALSGGADADTLIGGLGSDTLEGNAGADQLQGGDGNDVLRGGADDDTLEGGAGNDSLVGGNGADTVFGEIGNDIIAGGNGFDLFDASASVGDLSINLAAGVASGDEIGTDTLSGIEHVITGAGDDFITGSGEDDLLDLGAGDDTATGGGGIDTISGNAGADAIAGGAGNDILDGGDGDDTVSGGAGNDTLTGGAGVDTLDGGTGNDVLSGDDSGDTLLGGSGDDTITGGAGDDAINGQGDSDTIIAGAGVDAVAGGAGNDLIVEQDASGDDTYDGGDGTDTLDYTAVTGAVTVDLDAETAVGAGIGNDDVIGFENVIGGAGDDRVTGDGNANTLFGRAGDDTLIGAAGNDVFGAGDDTGDDTYSGGDGLDTVDFSAAGAAVTIDLSVGTASATGLGNDSLDGVERIIGGSAADNLTGGAGDETLEGGAGDDTLTGGAGTDFLTGGDGIDTVDYSSETGDLTVDLGFEFAIGDGIDTDIFSSIERVLSGIGDDLLFGSENNDVIEAGSGDDTVAAGDGQDTILGAAGVDSLDGGAGVDFVSGGDGNDILFGGAGADSLTGGNGDDALEGNNGADTLDGGDGNDELQGNDGADILNGDGGIDTLFGGAGSDTLDGGDGNDFLFGDTGNDVFVERDGSGNDEYTGGDGSAADSGSDTIDYSAVTTGITVNLANQTAVGVGIGNDEIRDIERVIGGAATDTLTGSDDADTLSGGGGSDELSGGEGDDRFIAALDAGDDSIDGGDGTDTLDYVNVTESVNIDVAAGTATAAGLGTDTFQSIEKFIGGDGDDTISGSDNDETLQGGAGADTLTGGAGDDSILGGGGDDNIDGGIGDDRLAGGAGVDTADYSEALETVEIDLAGGTANGNEIGADILTGFERVITGSGDDTITGSDAGEIFDSGAGSDSIAGGAGDDTLTGGTGDDTVRGGGGNDLVIASTDAATDSYAGGAGLDLLDYSALNTGLVADLAAGSVQFSSVTGTVNDVIIGFEGLIGGAGNDIIAGTSGDDTLIGGAGDDTLSGISGTDLIDGGAGNDLIFAGGVGNDDDIFDGGDGFDVLDLSEVTVGIVLNLENGTALAVGGQSIAKQIVNIEQIRASGGDDTILGSSGADVIDGGLGSDSIFAAGGADRITFDETDATIDGGSGVDVLLAAGAGQELDATSLARTSAIEVIDLSGNGANGFTATTELVREISDTGTVSVLGNGDDRVTTEGIWAVTGAGNTFTALNSAVLQADVDTLTNAGAISFEDGASLEADVFGNDGFVSVVDGDATVTAAVTNTVGGTISIASTNADATFIADGGLFNDGLITLASDTATSNIDILNGSLSNTGTVAVDSGVQSISGAVENLSGGTIAVNGGTLNHASGDPLTNAGQFDIAGGGAVVVGDPSGDVTTFANTGAVSVQGDFVLRNTAFSHDTGILEIDNGGSLGLSDGSTLTLDTVAVVGALGTLSLGDGGAVAARIDGVAALENLGVVVFNNGVLATSLVNQGTVTTDNGQYDVAGLLSTEGAGSLDLAGVKILAGGGTFAFSVDAELTAESVSVSTTASVVDGVTVTVSDTSVDGELSAAAGTEVFFAGALSGAGVLSHAGNSSLSTIVDIATVANSGELTLSGGTLSSADVTNSGNLDVVSASVLDPGAAGAAFNTGNVEIQDGAVLTFSEGLFAHSGDIDLNSTGTLAVAGGVMQLGSGASFSGSGEARFTGNLEIESGAIFTLNTPTFVFEGGDIGGSGAFVNQSQVNFTADTDIAASFSNEGTLSISGVDVTATGIELEADGTVTLDGSGTNASLTDAGGILLNAGLLKISGGAASLGGDTIRNAATGRITVDGGATLRQEAGDIENDGLVSIAQTGAMAVGSVAAPIAFSNGGTLSIDGSLNLLNTALEHSGVLSFGEGGVLDIGGSSTVDFQTNFTLLANRTINVGDGGEGTIEGAALVTNQGDIVFNNGTLAVALVNEGNLSATDNFYRINDDLTLTASGFIDLDASKTLTGSGQIFNQSDLNFEDDVIDVTFIHQDGALDISSVLEITKELRLEGAGVINAGSGVVIAGDGVLDNSGDITVTGATLDSSTLLNRGSLSFIDNAALVTSSAITNFSGGEIAAAVDVTFDLDAGEIFENFGLVDVNAGIFTFRDGTWQHSGVLDVALGASVAIVGGTLSLQSGGVLAGEGDISFSSALEVAAGVDFASTAASPTLRFIDGDLIGAGSFTNRAFLTMSGGTIAVSSFTNESGGALRVDNDLVEVTGAFANEAGSTLSLVADSADAAFVHQSDFANAGTVSFTGDVANTATFDLGTATLTNENGASVHATDGAHQIDGAVENQFGGEMAIETDGAGDAQLNVTGAFSNAGIVALNANGDAGDTASLEFGAGTLSNQAAGVVTFGGAASTDSLAIIGDIDNAGSLTVVSAASSSIKAAAGNSLSILNSGEFNVASASALEIGEAGALLASFGNSGAIDVSGGLTLRNTVLTHSAGTLDIASGGSLSLADGSTLDVDAGLTVNASGTIGLGDGTGAVERISGSVTLENQGELLFNGGQLDADVINTGAVVTGGDRYDVSGTLSTEGAGSVDLSGTKVLSGGGVFSFSNDFDLTDDTVAASTTVAAASGAEMTVSDTTVEGELIAESGSTVVFGGPLTGSGIFTHAAQGSTLTSVIDVSSLTNSGALSLSGGTLASADVFNSGNIEAVSASVLNPGASGTFANSGTIDIQDSVVLALENGRLEHGGTIDLNTSGTLSVVGGVLDLETDGVLAGAGQVLFAGDLSLDTGVSFTLSSTEFVFDGGEIIGDGSLVNQSAVRFAADSTVAGTLTNEGALSIEGASVTANGIGLSSGGTVTLDGSSADSSLTDSSGVLLNAGAVSVVGGTGSLIGTTVNNASGGTITVANGATLQKSGGTLVNAGEIEIENGGDLAIGAASGTPTQVENTGAVTANGNLTLLNTVFTHAAGDLDIDDGGSLGLNGGSTLDLGADVTIGTLGTLGLGDGGATAARVSGTGTLRNRGDLVFDNGVAAVDIINFGDLTTNNSQYDVAGTLTFQGGGTIDLTGANVLAGGGLYDFSVNTDLTEDTVASGTTVSVTSGSALSLTNTVVDGTLIAETGASVTYGGTLTGTGLFEHAVQGSTLSSTIDVSKLTNSGRLILSGGTVASADFVNSGNLDIVLASTVNPGSSGTFTNSDTVDIQNGIGLTFGAGVLANSGTIDLNASGTLSIAGGTLDLGAGGAVDGSGQARFSGNLNIGTGVTFTLSSTEFVFEGGDITGPGALINQGYVGFEADGAIGVAFTNEGTLSIDGASVTASEIELTSSGTLTLDGSSSDASLADSSGVLLNAGLVSLTAGIGSLSATTVSNASGATISVDDGATLRQDGGGTFLNAGEIALSGVLEITVGEAANTGALTFTAGTLDLSGGAVFDQTPDLTLSAGSEIVLDNSTLTGAGTLSIGGSVAFANNGVLALTAVNSGSVSTSNNRYDVSGSLATEGAGSIDLVGSKVLAGGGAYSFSNDFDLTTDTVAVSTTVSALSGSTMTVSDTTVDGELIAASGSAVVFGGDVTGAGSFDHAAAGSTLSATIDVSTLTNSGALELSSGTLASLNIENSGLLDVTASAVADPGAGGTLRNSGTIETQNGQVLTFDNGLLAHSGTIDLNTTGTLSVANGTFDVAAGSVFTGSGQARFAGDFNIGSGVTFTLSTAKFLFEGGDIAGDGTFVNQSDVNFTSDAAIAGAFTNNDSISIANASVTANDIGLSSGGTVSLDGTVFDAALTDSSGSLLNAGLVAVTAGTASLLATTVSNASGGTISVDDGATLQQDGGGTFLNEGDIALAGVLELAGGETSNTGALTFTSGTLELSGGAVFDQTPNLTLSAGSEIVLDDSTLTGAGTLSISGSVAFANNGALDLTAVNSGSVTTSNDRYDVSGSLATDGVGSVDLVGSKTLAGGGSYTFANDFDLSADTVAASTTVSALSGSTITVSDTVVEGALNAASGSDLAIDGTVTGGGSLSIAGSATFGSLGVLGIATVNTGTISAVDGQFDVSGSLATEGTGALDLSGSKTLAGGGAYTFANDANLTADTIAASTTVSALNGTTMTVSDTTVDGTLIAASGSNLSIDGTVTGGGALSIFGSAVFGTAGVLDVVAVNAGTVSTGDGTYDVSGSLATEGVGTVDLSGTKTLAGGGAYTFVNDFDLTADTVAASTTVSALNGSTLAVSDTTVDGALIAANGSDLSIDGTVTGSGTLSIAGSAALGTVGLIDVVAVNTGTLSADDSQFDVSGSLATEGSGALDLLGSKTLAGGGAYTFANDVDLTDDTVAASTTVSALSGSTLTVSTTTVDGVLIAASGSDLSIDGTVTGGGTLLIAGAATLGSLGVLDVVTVNTSTVSTVDGQYDVSGSLATEVSGALDLLGSKILAGGGAYTFANAFNLTADTIAASTAVSALSGSTLTVLDTIVDGTLIAESGSSVAFGGTLTGAGAFTHAALASTLSNVIDIAEFTNSGTMALSGGTVASADATNSGLLDVLTDSEIDPGVGGTFVNIGTIEIQDAVVLTLDNAALVNSGTIGIGDGASISMTTAASIQNAGGIINIGTGFGVATADGDISFDLTSRLLTDLGGTTAGTEHDQLAVTGTLTLGGTLDVSEVGTFSVGDGNSFQIIDTSAGTLAGSFDSVTGLETGDDFILDLTHNATGVSLVSRTVTVLGDDTGTTLTGTSGVDVILAKAGDDTIDGSGDTDLMHGGAGNDIFIAADVGFGRLDGGADFDLIDFTGDSDLTFNLTTLRGDQLSNIERIDISGTGTVGLVIDLDTVLSATGGTNSITGSDNDLIIDGDTGDTVDAGAGWVNTGTTTIAEINGYTVFENADSGAQIFVNSDVAVTIT